MNKPQEIPQHLIDRITERGGLSENGKPFFRVMWAPDVTEVRGQLWKDRDASGNAIREIAEYRRAPKYDCERFVFEMWTPPMCSETEWTYEYTKLIDGIPFLALPYPADGEYELQLILETPCQCAAIFKKQGRKWDGKCRFFGKYCSLFMPLTATLCDALIATAIRNREVPKARRVEHAKQRREAKEREQESRISDLLASVKRPFIGPFVSVLK